MRRAVEAAALPQEHSSLGWRSERTLLRSGDVSTASDKPRTGFPLERIEEYLDLDNYLTIMSGNGPF